MSKLSKFKLHFTTKKLLFQINQICSWFFCTNLWLVIERWYESSCNRKTILNSDITKHLEWHLWFWFYKPNHVLISWVVDKTVVNFITRMDITKSEIRDFVRIVFVCICWYIVSSSNGVLGKTILSQFPFPMTVTMVQLFSIAVWSPPLLKVIFFIKN